MVCNYAIVTLGTTLDTWIRKPLHYSASPNFFPKNLLSQGDGGKREMYWKKS